ncbi:MAG: ATP-grasp domain-containing protein [Gemmatimonadales bacterium]
MPPRVLLLLPSTTYQAGAFLEAARRLGADVTVGTDHASVFGFSQPDNLLALDFRSVDNVTRRIMELATRNPVAAVFGVDDETAVLAAAAARALGLRHAELEGCEAARDKFRQRTLLARAGLPAPAFALHRFDDDLAGAAAAQAYPCVLKPLHESMSRGVMRADDSDGFVRAAERLRGIVGASGAQPEFLVEAFVPGVELALEGCLEDGRLVVLALFDKPDPLDGPFFAETIYATPSTLPMADQRRVTSCVERAARAIGLTRGSVHAEVRLNDAGAWLIELAARPIGGRCSAVLRFGPHGRVSLEEVLLEAALKAWERGSAGAWERERLAAAVYMIPVPRAGTLLGVSGVDEAKRVARVEDVVITAHVGQALEPLPEGNRYLGFIYARAEHSETAVQAVRAAHAKLGFELA